MLCHSLRLLVHGKEGGGQDGGEEEIPTAIRPLVQTIDSRLLVFCGSH